MRLIDADKLKDIISDTWILDRIDEQPTVDAVPVVRCKDCKFYYEDEKWCERLGLCGAFNKNDFCSHGVRRKDGNID